MAIKTRNIQKTISIPSKYGSEARSDIGKLILRAIRRRTKNGVSVNGTAFKYAKGSTAKGSKLSESGDMLAAITVISHSDGSITVGYPNDGSTQSAKAEGNQIGSYGNPTGNSSIAKPYIGVSNDELDLVLNTYDSQSRTTDTGSNNGDNGLSETQVNDNFINTTLTNQGLT